MISPLFGSLNSLGLRRGATSWYLAGGAPMPVAAYQPIGAASLAASYVNLANPGTYDAAPGTAPGLAAGGWTFDGNSQYLTTGMAANVATQSWSALARFVAANRPEVAFRAILGERLAGAGIRIAYNHVELHFTHGLDITYLTVADIVTSSGVMAIAGKSGYLDGSSIGTFATASPTGTLTNMYIGAIKNSGVTVNYFYGTIAAVAIYSSTLSAAQVAAVSAAMAAL